MPKRTVLISKSNYMDGLTCPAYLWFSLNDKDFDDTPDLMTAHLMEQGSQVGSLARKLYPEGINAMVGLDGDTAADTQKLLKKRIPIFEAGFVAGPLYARVDILLPAANNAWDIVEVKGVTTIDESHIQDCAFQKYVCEKSGIKIRKTYLLYVNKDYIKKGAIKPEQLLICEDITEQAENEQNNTEANIGSLLKILKSKSKPKPQIISNNCNPKECAYNENCIGKLPNDSVFYLYRGGKKSKQLYISGIKRIRNIPKTEKLTTNQSIQLSCELKSCIHIDQKEIKTFLSQLKEPVYYMDFETYAVTIPRFDGMKPNQSITFQYSVHVQEKGRLTHYSYLAPYNIDPREEFLKELKSVLGKNGSIVVYNQAFEQSRLKELGEQFPKYMKWISSLDKRYIDLLLPFRAFSYYDPSQQGSASIKKVLPAITGKSYDNLAISNGGDASVMYYKASTGSLKEEESLKLRSDLEKYCGLDTEGMVWIVEKLKKLSE